MAAILSRALFAATVFVAASLVFLVQPMVARQLLPAFGGTPAVWNTAVVFFQLVLLAGYAFAHVSLRMLGPRRQPWLQLALALVVLGFLPFAIRADEVPSQSVPPAAWIGVLLALGVGVPYLAVATASPVLQRWYAAIGAPDSRDPYFLYSASNAGSLAGLLAFPFVLEPRLGIEGQELVWAFAFAAYLLGLMGCALVVWRRAPGREQAAPAPEAMQATAAARRPTRWQAVRWVFIAAVPASLMLGATTFITTDVASAPLLWVVPLSLYLVSFMVTFGRRVHVPPRPAGLLAAAATVALLLVELKLLDASELQRVGIHLAALLFAAVLCHSLLYAERPAAQHLTGFYLLLSLGGAIGGSFTALVAPSIFDGVYEYPLLLVAVLALRPAGWRGPGRWRDHVAWRTGWTLLELVLAGSLMFVFGSAVSEELTLTSRAWIVAIVLACALLAVRRWGLFVAAAAALALLVTAADRDAIHVSRNFYGTLRVERDDGLHRLMHGTTLHGAQFRDPERRGVATTYYVEEGPVGDIFGRLQEDEPFVEVGAVGLGTGSLLAYARLWQRFTYFEIDPAVIRVAQDPEYFTYLEDAQVAVRIVEGDARLRLRDERDARFDLLVLDAYSSDAVPVHLLTVEAFELYLHRLAPGGVIAVHISSRHLDLEPVVSGIADRLQLAGLGRVDAGRGTAHFEAEGTGSHWLVLARELEHLAPLTEAESWGPLVAADGDDAWTDDRSGIAGAITWLPGND